MEACLQWRLSTAIIAVGRNWTIDHNADEACDVVIKVFTCIKNAVRNKFSTLLTTITTTWRQGLRCFIAAGQFAFPFCLLLDPALLVVEQCSPTLNQSAQLALVGIALRGIPGSTQGMTFMTQDSFNNALRLRKDTHAQNIVDVATGSG